MATRSLFDQVVDSFTDAVSDVREKLVEEAWFGRATTPQGREDDHDACDAAVQPSTPEQPLTWDQVCAQMGHQHTQEPGRDIEHGMDR